MSPPIENFDFLEPQNFLFKCDFCGNNYAPDGDSIIELSPETVPDSYLKELDDSGEKFLDFPIFSSNVEFHWSAKRFVSCCENCQQELDLLNAE